VNRAAKTLLAGLTAAALVGAPAPSRADERADRLAQAANFFDAGAQAYDAGKYLVAAEAFEKAHALAPSASLLFSTAQAYRRLYLLEPSPDVLRRALGLYREYLRSDPAAKRRDDAMRALESLQPAESRLTPADGSTAIAHSSKAGTRLLLSTRGEGAQVSVDGGPLRAAPAVVQVSPGKHEVLVRAPGYYEERLAVVAVSNELTPRHVPLRPRPARLRVLGTSGARVLIDGQLRATVPTEGALAIEPGRHFLAVTRAGHEPHGQVIELGRDESAELTIELPPTRQRIAAWTVLSAGAASAVASGVLAGLSLSEQSDATALRDRRESVGLTPAERDRYNAAVAARDDLTLAAAITGGAALLSLATGAALYAFDDPEILPPADDRDTPKGPERSLDFTVGALWIGASGAF
jgi:hypothetical protein